MGILVADGGRLWDSSPPMYLTFHLVLLVLFLTLPVLWSWWRWDSISTWVPYSGDMTSQPRLNHYWSGTCHWLVLCGMIIRYGWSRMTGLPNRQQYVSSCFVHVTNLVGVGRTSKTLLTRNLALCISVLNSLFHCDLPLANSFQLDPLSLLTECSSYDRSLLLPHFPYLLQGYCSPLLSVWCFPTWVCHASQSKSSDCHTANQIMSQSQLCSAYCTPRWPFPFYAHWNHCFSYLFIFYCLSTSTVGGTWSPCILQ